EMDGKGDEIFVNCNWIMAGRNNATEFEGKYRSPMYGDVNRHYGWVQAGSRSDKGGIRSGDQYRGYSAIGEFDISDGETLTIMPTIWEWDGNEDEMTAFMSFLTGHVNEIKNASLQLIQGVNQLSGGNTSQFLLDMGNTNLSLFSMAVNAILGQAKDRPIGLDAAGRFKSKAFVLNRGLCRDIAQRNLGYGLGVLQMDYDENQLGNTRDHGAYTILIKIELLGSGSTTATTPSNPPGRYIPPPMTTPPAGTATHGSAPVSNPPAGTPTHGSTPVSNPAGGSSYIPPPSTNSPGAASHGSAPVSTPASGGRYIPPPVANPAGRGGAPAGAPNGASPAGPASPSANPAGPSANPAGPAGGAVSIPGTWTGTYGDGPSSTSHGFFSLQFNADGSLLMLDPRRAVLARGSYVMNGISMTGSLSWLAGGRYLIAGRTKGPTMTGTWGRETSNFNGGNWTLTKQ
ncbi:MAG TPA: hypothetical protein VKQ52_10840, partial [Puia sp.]|nr:hypothetical protein [Puia sp.]